MKGIAHVSFQGGGLILPAHTPYDRELLFEHVEASAKQHGGVRLDWRHQHWTVSVSNGQREVCAACRRPAVVAQADDLPVRRTDSLCLVRAQGRHFQGGGGRNNVDKPRS
jgi:hypothetical protein